VTGPTDSETRPSAVPPTAKGRRTRARVVGAAADLVYQRGVAAVTLDEVREASGTGKSQLYHYFTDRDDLVHAVIDYQCDRVLGLHASVLDGLSSWEDLGRWRDLVVANSRRHDGAGGCPIGSLANELAETDDRARLELADAFDRWVRLLAEGLDRMVQAGALRGDADTARLAVATIASLQGGLLLAETARDADKLEIALDAALDHLRTFAGG
jgi:TetR/AcrR family transcriptional regulator, transcriptional repressor for nem operon